MHACKQDPFPLLVSMAVNVGGSERQQLSLRDRRGLLGDQEGVSETGQVGHRQSQGAPREHSILILYSVLWWDPLTIETW